MDSCLRQKESTLSSSGGGMRYFERDPNIISARNTLREEKEEKIRKKIERYQHLKKFFSNKSKILKKYNPGFESMNF